MTWISAITLRSKVMTDALATENYAKKVRVTPRIKSYIPSSSNLARNINVLKIVEEFSSDQEIRQDFIERWIF